MMTVVVADLLAEQGAATPVSDFDGWMRAEQRRVYLLCLRMLADRDEADTATQDVFLKAYQASVNAEQPVADPARWLTRITVNTCLDRLRSRRWQFWRRARINPEAEETVLLNQAAGQPGAESHIFARQIRTRLEQALERLSPRQRAVFALRHYEGKDLEEIADILGLEQGSVKSHMFRATAKLREELKDLYYGAAGK
jgi:RNA polymerase sigma-70 factor (ECF subfamily)